MVRGASSHLRFEPIRNIASQLIEGLIAVLYRTKAKLAVASLPGGMKLAKGDHGLPVTLLHESHQQMEFVRVVVDIGTVNGLDQRRALNALEDHSVAVAGSVRSDHIEAPNAARGDFDLLGFDGEAFRTEPFG